MRQTGEARQAMRQEALSRATTGQALTNYPTIYQGFMEKGLAEADIQPRVNVLTFEAWRALGRHVRRGEHGVKVVTWIPIREQVNADGEVVSPASKRPKTAVVFHLSQTEPDA